MAKKRGLNAVSVILLSAAAAMFILSLVGACIGWIFVDLKFWIGDEMIDVSGTRTYTLTNLLSKLAAGFSGDVYGTTQSIAAFAILTPIFAGLTAILAGVCGFFNNKVLKISLAVCSVAAVVFAILCIIMTYSLCGAASEDNGMGYFLGVGLYSPMAGMWLTAIGGVLAGAVGTVAALRR